MIRRLIIVGLFGFPCLAQAAGEVPLVAKVVTPSAVTRCGPGERHYQTQSLKLGTEVEIYRRNRNGWLAIRPPRGSYSWVRAKQLTPTGSNGLSRVQGDEVVAWVAASEEIEGGLKWQVRLEPNEVVEVHDQQQLQVVPDLPAEEYYLISPPAGEYRWIHESDVEALRSGPEVEVELANFQIVVDGEGDRLARKDTFVPRQANQPVEERRVASRTPIERTPQRAPISKAEFDRRIKDLDLRLALGVSRSPRDWSFGELESELEELAASADSTLQRARAQVLENRLAEYSELKQRYAGLNTEVATDSSSGEEDASEARAVSERGSIDPRFDGLGWLLPVHSRKPSSPPYALLDKDGKILQFVSPAPGLNLHRYLRKEVGIFGQRAAGVSLDKPHLTAHRVVDMRRHR